MILTFYSYKGGVGRTQLAANLAAYLCYHKQKKVLLIDWDLEAPGLHYYFSNNKLQSSNGVIELFQEYVKLIQQNRKVEERELPVLDENYRMRMATAKRGGIIDLITAGNYSKKYNQNISDFNWYEFYELLDGKIYIEFIKDHLRSLDYDFIFIDSRTGMSDYSGICNIQIPDANIILVSPTHQNFEGAVRIAHAIVQSPYVSQGYRKPIIFPVLSRIDLSIEHKSEEWIDEFSKQFTPFIKAISKFYIISEDDYLKAALLDYKRDISFGEQVLFSSKTKSIQQKTLASQYQELAKLIEQLQQYTLSLQQSDVSIVKLEMTGTDRIGIVDEITKVIVNDSQTNMRSINVNTDSGVFKVVSMLYLKEIKILNTVVNNLKQIEGVKKVKKNISKTDFEIKL